MGFYTRFRDWQDNANPVGGGSGPALDATVLDQWEAAHQAASDVTDELATRISAAPSQWAASTSYTAGTYVIAPGGDLVAALEDHTSPASFDAGQWTAATYAAAVSGIPVDPVTRNVPLTWELLGAAPLGAVMQRFHAPAYFYCCSPESTQTSTALGNEQLRLAPWFVADAIHITKIFAEIISAGQADSTYRIGIYSDNGVGYPNELVVDGGSVAADVIGTPEVTVDVTLDPGLYWIGGAVQGASITQPGLRILSVPLISIPMSAKPAAAAGPNRGYSRTGVAGTLPATFGGSGLPAGSAPRMGVYVDGTSRVEPGVVFDARNATNGLSSYRAVIHPERISIVNDPVLGATRKVMKMTVFDTDTGPTSNPRAQVEPPANLVNGSEFWFGFGLYLPADWPVFPAGGWSTLAEIYGPPYGGHSPAVLGVWKDDDDIVMNRNSNNGSDYPWRMPVLRGQWIDFAWHVKLSTDPTVGFYELDVNTGSGWESQLLNGATRMYMSTLDSTNSGGPNHAPLKLYRGAGLFEVLTCYFANHRVGLSRAKVDPRSFD